MKYVCFEGINGAGKTTLAKAVVAALNILHQGPIPQAVYQPFPSDNYIGLLLRDYLNGSRTLEDPKALLHLYAADGVEQRSWIEDTLDVAHVVGDRHPLFSALVYQTKYHSLATIEAILDSLPIREPDQMFFIEVPPDLARDRLEKRYKYRDALFPAASADVLAGLQEDYLIRMGWFDSYTILDGTLPVDELVDRVIREGELREPAVQTSAT